MARLSLNVDQETFDSAGRTFEPVPAGTYTVSIFAITPDTVKNGDNKGKPRLRFQFRIVDGETAPDGSNQGNRRLFSDMNAFEGTGKDGKPTPPYDLVALGKAIGLSAEDLADADTDDWLQEELQVTVTHRRKQHQVNGTWVDIEPAEYREQIRGYRSLESVATSAVAASAAVAGVAPSAAPKAKAAGAKFKL